MKEFGEALPGIRYVDRPGGYGFLWRDHRELAVVQTPAGLFLPGGGADPGESPEAALRREIFEEIAYTVTSAVWLGEAAQYHWSDYYRQHFRKHGQFYRVEASAPTVERFQADHSLLWLPLREASAHLTQEFQRWAVENFASP